MVTLCWCSYDTYIALYDNDGFLSFLLFIIYSLFRFLLTHYHRLLA